MSKYANDDHYLDAATGVLKNLLGITAESELEKAEAAFASIRSFEMTQNPIPGAFDLEHLKAIHHHLFKDVYPWAGQCRTINVAKDNNFFAHHAHIEADAKTIFESLLREKCLAGLPKSLFSERAAFYLGEINALHPFREGNGRAQREFISHLVYKNGCFLDWRNITQSEMIEASIDSFKGDYSKFSAYIRDNIKNVDQ